MKHFKPQIFVGFLLGAVFTIVSEVVVALPARVPIWTDYSVPSLMPELHYTHHVAHDS